MLPTNKFMFEQAFQLLGFQSQNLVIWIRGLKIGFCFHYPKDSVKNVMATLLLNLNLTLTFKLFVLFNTFSNYSFSFISLRKIFF